MSFQVYQIEAFKKYLIEYEKTTDQIYKLIRSSDLPKTYIAIKCGMTYPKYARHLKLKNFSLKSLLEILNAIK